MGCTKYPHGPETLIKIDFKQVYCSYSRTSNSECFSIISVIFAVNIVDEQQET